MSGPIIRRYGFPNFEKIFGDRPPAHGQDGPSAETTPDPARPEPAKADPPDEGPASSDRPANGEGS